MKNTKHIKSFAEFIKESVDNKEITDERIEEILTHYMICALWSSNNIDSEREEPLDQNYSIADISDDTKEKMKADVTKFLTDNLEALNASGLEDKQIGHDFWLSRNGHGAGFFDHSLDKDIEDKLMEASRKFGTIDLFVNDDKKIQY